MAKDSPTGLAVPNDDHDAGGDYWRQSIEDELASIQKDVLSLAILGLPILGIVWLAVALPNEMLPLVVASRPATVLFISSVAAHYLRRSSRHAASWLIVAAMIVAVCLIVAPHT